MNWRIQGKGPGSLFAFARGSGTAAAAAFRDLLDAFSQDVVKNRYANFAEVLDYSRRSANPVGRLLLHLFHKDSPGNCELSDSICSALQLINFWQDVRIDYETKDRIYLPQDEMRRFGVRDIAAALLRGFQA